MPDFWGYGRGSTQEQEDTITLQEEKLRKEFDRRFKEEGYSFGGIFLDRGVSGSKRLRNRPEGYKLTHNVKPGDVVVICKLDRGFRNALDFLTQMQEWVEQDIRLVMLDIDIDTGRPIGKMVATILAAVAEFERHMISQRTKEWAAGAKARGKPVSGTEPYGFKLHGPRGQRCLVPDKYSRAYGGKFLELSEAGYSLDRIYWHAFRSSWKTRKGKEWSRSAIDRAIQGERALRATEALRKK